MKVKELIDKLEKLPQDLEVFMLGKNAQQVVVDECEGHKYVCIYEPYSLSCKRGR